jgi:2-desacetyl-2-hydroxyethyl bacteriochlorophyllide A dehydrogenase
VKALVLRAIGELSYEDVPDAKIERSDEVLVRIRAVGVCGSDVHGYLGHTGRRIPPMIMGHEASGDVVGVGSDVTRFRVGDRVALFPMQVCGQCDNCKAGKSNICIQRQLLGAGQTMKGALAEYIAWPEKSIFPIPDRLSYENAALAEPTAVSAHAVNRAVVEPGGSVLIVGVGTIGLLALACARAKAPGKVFVSDVSDDRLAVALGWGADVTVNPKSVDAVEFVREQTGGKGVDRAIEAVGNTAAAMQSIRATRTGGLVVWIGNAQKIIEIDMQDIVTRELDLRGTYAFTDTDFVEAIGLLADGRIPVEKLVGLRGTLAEGGAVFAEVAKNLTILKSVLLLD